jgi:hypothetical protein
VALIKRLGMGCRIRRPSEQALAANARFTSPPSPAAPQCPPPPRPAAAARAPVVLACGERITGPGSDPAPPLVEPTPPAPPRLRAPGWIALQRRAFELQEGEVEGAPDPPDPLDAGVAAFDFLVLVAAGECDLADFRAGALAAWLRAPRELLPGVGHLAPMANPEAFRWLRRLRA